MAFSQFLISLYLWHAELRREMSFPTCSHRQFTCHKIQTFSLSPLQDLCFCVRKLGSQLLQTISSLEFLFLHCLPKIPNTLLNQDSHSHLSVSKRNNELHWTRQSTEQDTASTLSQQEKNLEMRKNKLRIF